MEPPSNAEPDDASLAPWERDDISVASQVPELRPGVLSRARSAARRQMRLSATQGAIFLLFALMQSASSRSGPSWGWFLFVGLGLFPFVWAAIELRAYRDES